MKFFKNHLDTQLIIWVTIGVITLSIDALFFTLMFKMTNLVIFSNFVSGILAITFNYLSHYKITFKSEESHQKSGIKYFINLAVFWCLNSVFLKIWLTYLNYPLIAKLTLGAIQAPINYITLRNFVFTSRKLKN